jgi:hypothetical protein
LSEETDTSPDVPEPSDELLDEDALDDVETSRERSFELAELSVSLPSTRESWPSSKSEFLDEELPGRRPSRPERPERSTLERESRPDAPRPVRSPSPSLASESAPERPGRASTTDLSPNDEFDGQSDTAEELALETTS